MSVETQRMTVTLLAAVTTVACNENFSWETLGPGGGVAGALNKPVIVLPAAFPHYTNNLGNIVISGNCENGTDVILGGDILAGEVVTPPGSLSQPCAGTNYIFVIGKAADGTFNLTLHAEKGEEFSDPVHFTWVRDNVAPATPSIATPAADPYVSNSSPLTISGACETGAMVNITGDHVDSVTCAAASYSFVVPEGADGTYNYSIAQTDPAGNASAAEAQQWQLDTIVPDIAIDIFPPDPNSGSAIFQFSSTDPTATFECELDGGGYAPCTSPNIYSALSAAAHVFRVRSRDPAGNISAPASYGWTQNSVKTVALYHLDSAAPLADAGIYGNTLTDFGTANFALGKFSQARDFVRLQSDYMSAPDDASFGTTTQTMTVEAFVNFSSLPGPSEVRLIASQTNNPAACANDCGWRFYLTRTGAPGTIRLAFGASIDNGASIFARMSASYSASTGVWYHVAVTWDKGLAEFFIDGVSQGTGTYGTVGTEAIHDTSANFEIGRDPSADHFDGAIDEVRISNVVRAVTLPPAAYTAD